MGDHVDKIPNIKEHCCQDHSRYETNITPLIFNTKFQIAMSKKFLTTE